MPERHFSKEFLLDQLDHNRTEFFRSVLEADKPLHERKGHALQKHLDLTPENALNRLLMEKRSAISLFPSYEAMCKTLETVLREKADQVVLVQNGIREEANIADVMCMPSAGTYISNNLQEYSTPFSNVSIQTNLDSKYGFYVETLYAREPSGEHEKQYVMPTGKFFKNDDLYYGMGINRDVNSQIRWYLEHEKQLPVKQLETGDLHVDIRKKRHHFRVLISDGEIKKYIRTIPGENTRNGDSVRTDDSDRRSLQLLKEFRKECPELQQIKEDIAEFVRSLKAHERGYGGMGLHKVEISVDQEQYQNYMRGVLRATGELETPIYNGFDTDRKLYLFEQPVILNGIIHASIDDIANPEARAIAEEYYEILFSDRSENSFKDGSQFTEESNELQGIPPGMYEKIKREHDRSLIEHAESVSEQDQDLYQSSYVHISRSDDIDLGDER